MLYEYRVESFVFGDWIRITNGSLGYCRGFFDARKEGSPRNAYRVIRSDGKVIDEFKARNDVHIGVVAGWPTAEQYEIAAQTALKYAQTIRQRTEGQLRTE